ncbi:MAG: FadR family transcriptional regulator [Dehalococcoidia bacterium]|nr:FadR family transcriptional regulator [Dehalococcoidia bacterium]
MTMTTSTSGDSTAGESAVVFDQVAREPRLSDKVAGMMLETILSEKLSVGDRLPSERELGEQFGVSRTVIREAVRALVAKGVIEVRSGSGLRVAAVEAAAVSEAMSLFIRSGSVDFEKVHEVRAWLETHIAELAAQRVTEADIERLRTLHRRMREESQDVEAAARDDLEFHRVLAAATGNEIYPLLMDSIGSALIEIRRQNLGSGAMSMTLDQHEAVLDRVAAHDSRGARQAMQDHLDAVAAWWRDNITAKPPTQTPRQ